MRNPGKLLFITLALVIVVMVSWHLQTPSGGVQSVSQVDCPTSATDINKKQKNTNSKNNHDCDSKQESTVDTEILNQITKIRLFQFEGNHTQWTLNAPEAQNIGEESVVIQEPELTMYKRSGQTISISSQSGSMDYSTRVITFSGNVVVSNYEQRFSTSILRFDPNERILYTDEAFLMESGYLRLEGVGFTLYQETRKLVVSHQVKVQMGADVNARQESRKPQAKLADILIGQAAGRHLHCQQSMNTPGKVFQLWKS